jgi:hypothetical protein
MMLHITSIIHEHKALFLTLVAWEGIWKSIAMWKSARNNDLAWFVCIAVFNTVGLLPIIYILWERKNKRIIVDPNTQF